jgi:hypothetical protein
MVDKRLLIPELPDEGSKEWEDMVDYMRKDLEGGMMYTKIQIQARKILKAQGKDFDVEFLKWKEDNNASKRSV